jgi:hypothetical protein
MERSIEKNGALVMITHISRSTKATAALSENTARSASDLLPAGSGAQSGHVVTPSRSITPISAQREEDLALDAEVRLWTHRTYLHIQTLMTAHKS